MSAIFTIILPLILKYLLPLISAWFAAKGHATLSANPDATAENFQQLYAAWAAIGASGLVSGNGIQWLTTRNVGAIDTARLMQIFSIVLHLIEVFAPDKYKPMIEALLKILTPEEAKSLGITR